MGGAHRTPTYFWMCTIIWHNFTIGGGCLAPPLSKIFVWAKNFLKNGGFGLSDILDQNRPFSRFERAPRGSGWCPRIEKWAKKGVKKGSKRPQNGYFCPFSAIFRRFSINVDFGLYVEIPYTMCRAVVFQKKVWGGYFEIRGFKIGHFRGLSRNSENQGLGGDGPVVLSLSDPGFD